MRHLKTDNHILSIVLRANGLIGWMVRHFISKKTNGFLKIRIEYCTQVWASLLRHGNWNVISRLDGIQKRVTKIIKRVKDYSYKERLEKLGLTTLIERRTRSWSNWNFQIILIVYISIN